MLVLGYQNHVCLFAYDILFSLELMIRNKMKKYLRSSTANSLYTCISVMLLGVIGRRLLLRPFVLHIVLIIPSSLIVQSAEKVIVP